MLSTNARSLGSTRLQPGCVSFPPLRPLGPELVMSLATFSRLADSLAAASAITVSDLGTNARGGA